jgi:hypothetical protein
MIEKHEKIRKIIKYEEKKKEDETSWQKEAAERAIKKIDDTQVQKNRKTIVL